MLSAEPTDHHAVSLSSSPKPKPPSTDLKATARILKIDRLHITFLCICRYIWWHFKYCVEVKAAEQTALCC